MAKITKDIQKSYFYEGAYPTDEQFHDVIESQLGILEDVSQLPTASSSNLNDEYKIGNVFYKCIQEEGAYRWKSTGQSAPTNSYNDLTDKPSINGTRIAGSIADIDSLGALSKKSSLYSTISDKNISSSDIVYIQHNETWYRATLAQIVSALKLTTLEYIAGFRDEIMAEARTLVQQQMDSKLNADLSNLTETSSVSDDGYIPIVTDGEARKIQMANIAAYTEIKSTSSRQGSSGSGNSGCDCKETKTLTIEVTPDLWVADRVWNMAARVANRGITDKSTVVASPTPESINVWMSTPFYFADIDTATNEIIIAAPQTAPEVSVSLNIIYQ